MHTCFFFVVYWSFALKPHHNGKMSTLPSPLSLFYSFLTALTLFSFVLLNAHHTSFLCHNAPWSFIMKFWNTHTPKKKKRIHTKYNTITQYNQCAAPSDRLSFCPRLLRVAQRWFRSAESHMQGKNASLPTTVCSLSAAHPL